MIGDPIPMDAVTERLLASVDPQARVETLRESGRLNAPGLGALLDAARQRVGRSPAEAIRLAETCALAADSADAPALRPAALYVRAQAEALGGSFEASLALIDSARAAYADLGDAVAAVELQLGRINVLNELGRHDEAIAAGEAVLKAALGNGRPALPMDDARRGRMASAAQLNLGVCYRRKGRFEEALELFEAAEASFETMGEAARVADVRMGRGNLLQSLGHGDEALAVFESAAATFEREGLSLQHARALTNLAYARLGCGDYAASLSTFEAARRGFSEVEGMADRPQPLLLLDRAEAYLALNLYPEALAGFEEAAGLLEAEDMRFELARARWGEGACRIALAEYPEAEAALAAAASGFEAGGNRLQQASIRLEQAALESARGRQDAARDHAESALRSLESGTGLPQQVFAQLRLVDLSLPDAERAESHLRSARKAAEGLQLPDLAYRFDQRLARIRRAQGRDDEAQALLESAVDSIEAVRGTLPREGLRRSFLRDKTAAYEDLVRIHLERGDPESIRAAFGVAERAKSRSLVDVLAGLVDARLGAIEDEGLRHRLAGLRADLNAIYSGMLGDSNREGERAVLLYHLQQRAVEVERALSLLKVQVGASAEPGPLASLRSMSELLAELPGDEILLAYHVVDDEIVAFVSSGKGMQAQRRLASASEVAHLIQRLGAQLDRFRVGSGFVGRHMKMLKASTDRILGELYDALIRPVEGLLCEALEAADGPQRLTVVPHGVLHHVPFHALHDGRAYLIERFEIASAPSTMVRLLCEQRAPRRKGRSLVIGVDDPRIPAAAREAKAVAGLVDGAQMLLGEAATCASLEALAADCDLLHLACHGLFRADNPMYSSLKLQDGWLTAEDIARLDLNGALVTLSACESGRAQVIGGDEVLGLSRAFLGAGAATLTVSLWLVQDDTTAALMTEWYRGLRRGLGPAAALRAAQLGLMAHHPHPYYWAPFVVMGRR